MRIPDIKVGDLVFHLTSDGRAQNRCMYICVSDTLLWKRLYPEERYVRVPMNSIATEAELGISRPIEDQAVRDRLTRWFDKHNYDYRAARLYWRSIKKGGPFTDDLPEVAPDLKEISESEYVKRYHGLLLLMQPGVFIFTYNPRSITSRLICAVTHGPWSHCATVYLGYTLCDMRPAGLVQMPIEAYYMRRLRMALYRVANATEQQTEQLTEEIGRTLTGPRLHFGFKAAIKAGWLNLRRYDNTKLPTPMDLVYGGNLSLIHVV